MSRVRDGSRPVTSRQQPGQTRWENLLSASIPIKVAFNLPSNEAEIEITRSSYSAQNLLSSPRSFQYWALLHPGQIRTLRLTSSILVAPLLSEPTSFSQGLNGVFDPKHIPVPFSLPLACTRCLHGWLRGPRSYLLFAESIESQNTSADDMPYRLSKALHHSFSHLQIRSSRLIHTPIGPLPA